jgi:hypothetical protein
MLGKLANSNEPRKKMKNFKDLRNEIDPKNSTFGTNRNPMDPWSQKADIAEGRESLLDKYISSLGFDPDVIPLNQKIGYSKDHAFEKWKADRVSRSKVQESLDENSKEKFAGDEVDIHSGDHQGKKGKIVGFHGDHVEVKTESGEHVYPHEDHIKVTKSSDIEENSKFGMTPHTDETRKKLNKLVSRAAKHREVKTPPGSMHGLRIKKEDKFSDSYAASLTVGMETENKSKSSKLVKMIKKLREDLYDHEKEDKSVQTYGKKPKFDKTDEKENSGENKPKAAAVMSGGTTLTKQKRDVIEIDPLMRMRPGQPDPTKKDDKKKQEDKQKK